MRSLIVAVMMVALPTLPAVSEAQLIAGAGGGGSFLVRDGKTVEVGEILTEIGYRFALSADGTHAGELVALYGQQVNSGQAGGMAYRHYVDWNKKNNVRPGFTLGGFALGSGDVVELTQTTLFLGGGVLLDITPQDDDTVQGYAEVYESFAGDEGTLVRFGIRAAMN